MTVLQWHIITGEYPPTQGGVADYTEQLARGLAATGDEVHVWTPGIDRSENGIVVHGLPDQFGAASLRMLDAIPRSPTTRLLLQYVPQAFGMRGLNLGFCRWLARVRPDRFVMYHEVAFPFELGNSIPRMALALVQRRMARTVGRTASAHFVSTEAWTPSLRRVVAASLSPDVLPIPSNVTPKVDIEGVRRTRVAFGGADREIVGHFGTAAEHIRAQMIEIVPRMLRNRAQRTLVLLGRGAAAMRADLQRAAPDAADRIVSLGDMSLEQLSLHLAACDVMVQPYADGVTTRRTTVMAALQHGLATVTTDGPLTEAFWRTSPGVRLARVGNADAFAARVDELLQSPEERATVGEAGRALYDQTFDLRHTITRLRERACSV